jgi:NAD(P)-dependent dehydrogenase (short-subunit alcohol dehydrogenase family)
MQDEYFDFSNKVVLITGGSRGLGKTMALAFAARGANLVIASRKYEACLAVAEEVRALGRRALPVAVHMGDWENVNALCERAYEEFGRVDILINNAGISPLAESMDAVSEGLFDKIMAVNVKGPFRLATLVAQRMLAAEGGSIINISSIGAQMPSPYFGPYAGAKAALNAISTALAIAYAPKVRVNVISPGGFLTDIAGDWADDPEGLAGVPMGRFGRPEEIVTTALYLASEHSSFTTNANIRVDGGCRFVKI